MPARRWSDCVHLTFLEIDGQSVQQCAGLSSGGCGQRAVKCLSNNTPFCQSCVDTLLGKRTTSTAISSEVNANGSGSTNSEYSDISEDDVSTSSDESSDSESSEDDSSSESSN